MGDTRSSDHPPEFVIARLARSSAVEKSPFLMILVFSPLLGLGSGSLRFALTRRKKRGAGLRFGHRHRAQKRMLELWLIQGAK